MWRGRAAVPDDDDLENWSRSLRGVVILRECSGAAMCPSVSHACYSAAMAEAITQRELRNESGEIMRRLDQGEAFVVTRNGVPVGELIPWRRRRFVARETVVAAFAHAPAIDATRFRGDLHHHVSQDIKLRA